MTAADMFLIRLLRRKGTNRLFLLGMVAIMMRCRVDGCEVVGLVVVVSVTFLRVRHVMQDFQNRKNELIS